MSVRIAVPGARRLAELDPGVPAAFARDYVINLGTNGAGPVRAVAVFHCSEADAARVAALGADERVPKSARGQVTWTVRVDGAHAESGASVSDASGDAHGASRTMQRPAKGCRVLLSVRSPLGDAEAAVWFVRAEVSLRSSGELTADDARSPRWREVLHATGQIAPARPAERALQSPGGAHWPADLHQDLGEAPGRLGLQVFRHRFVRGGARPGTRYAALVELRASVRPATLPLRVYFARFVPRWGFDRARAAGDWLGDEGTAAMPASLGLGRRSGDPITNLSSVAAERPDAHGDVFDVAAPGFVFEADGRDGPSGVAPGAAQVYLADFEDVLCLGDPARLPRLWAAAMRDDAAAQRAARAELDGEDYPGGYWAAKILGLWASVPKNWYCSLQVSAERERYPDDGSGWRFRRLRFDSDSRVGEGSFVNTPIAQRHRGRVRENVREGEDFEVSLVTDAGAPVPYAAFVARFPGGERITGRLGPDGKAMISPAPAGEPEVYFPMYATEERKEGHGLRGGRGCVGPRA